MAAQAARRSEYAEYSGKAAFAPAFGAAFNGAAAYAEPAVEPQEMPSPAIRAVPRTRAAQKARGISLFSVAGTLLAVALMVFVVLAQINYNEIATDTVRLNAQLDSLTEQERRLEIAFESVIDMKEVERYARDVLGMSNPDANQISIIERHSEDKAEILDAGNKEDSLQGFIRFITSLLEYIR